MNFKGILSTVKNFAVPTIVIRTEKPESEYDADGTAIAKVEVRGTVQLHYQPIEGKDLNSLAEGDRTKEPLRFWTLQKVGLDDKIVIDGFIYTIRGRKYWPCITLNGASVGYYEGMMIRSGEDKNIDDA